MNEPSVITLRTHRSYRRDNKALAVDRYLLMELVDRSLLMEGRGGVHQMAFVFLARNVGNNLTSVVGWEKKQNL